MGRGADSQGGKGRRGARGAGRRKVATWAGARGAAENSGANFISVKVCVAWKPEGIEPESPHFINYSV
jgi:hypothetical protein